MNIVYANIQEFNPQIGGVERVTDTLVREFIKNKDLNIYLLAVSKSVYSTDYTPPVEQYFFPDKKQFNSKENLNFIINFLKCNDIDVIVNQAGNNFEYSQFWISVTKNSRVKLIFADHFNHSFWLRFKSYSTPSFFITDYRLFRRIRGVVINFIIFILKIVKFSFRYTYSYNNADKIVLLSERYITDYNRLILTRTRWTDKIIAISNPILIDNNSIIKNDKQKQLIFVGRLNKSQKGVDYLLLIWKDLSIQFPDWNLIIIGDGADRFDMEHYITNNNIQRVKILGFEEPLEYYKSASILCMTSIFEGFGMVLIEAMQHGCVPIAFDSFKGIHDIISHEINGFLIEPFNIEQYIDTLVIMMSNNQRILEPMRGIGSKSIAKFDVEEISKQWINLFNDLCD